MTTQITEADYQIEDRPTVEGLRRRAEASAASIARMERSAKRDAGLVAALFGVLGAGMVAASIFMGPLSFIPFMIGMNGVFAWCGGVYYYRKIKASRTAKFAPLIDRERDAIFAAGEQAIRLAR